MDFATIKAKAIEAKNKAIAYGAETLSGSGLILQSKNEIDSVIAKSKTTEFKNKETWELKYFEHFSIIIFAQKDSDFFKDALYALPVLAAKAFSQNMILKIAHSDSEGINLDDYKIKTLPTLIIFKEEKIYKSLTGSESILKLVKSANMDIKGLIDTIS